MNARLSLPQLAAATLLTLTAPLSAATLSYTRLVNADFAETGVPNSGLIEGSDGRLYGVTSFGGPPPSGTGSGSGTIYAINKDGSGFTTLHSFVINTEGTEASGQLVEAADGFLYGVCFNGRNFATGLGAGSIFRVNKSGSTFQVIKLLEAAATGASTSTTGQRPNTGLMQASDGKLYGVTQQGGTSDKGVLYSLTPGAGVPAFAVVFNFSTVNVSQPASVPVELADGKLYGVTLNGGANNKGVLYRINKTGSGYEVMHDFTAAEGNAASPVLISSTRFVGSTATLFGAANTLYTFDQTAGFSSTKTFDTSAGTRTVIASSFGSDGKLYGIRLQTSNPSIDASEFIRMNLDGTGIEPLFTFNNSSNAKRTAGPLLEIGTDAFVGTTLEGGTNFAGTIFRLGTAPPTNVPPTPSAQLPAAITFAKKKVSTAAGKLKISGICTGGRAFTVEFRVGKKGAFKPAKGTDSWSFTAKLKPGKNLVFVQARLGDGSVTPIAKATVIRK